MNGLGMFILSILGVIAFVLFLVGCSPITNGVAPYAPFEVQSPGDSGSASTSDGGTPGTAR